MTELTGWVVLLGLVVIIAGIYMLSSQIERHMRDTTESIIYSNEMILAQLKRLADPSARMPEPAIGMILERRHAQRRNLPAPAGEKPDNSEHRKTPGRRLEDFLATG